MNLSVTHRGAYAPPVEFVERKGLGHPDTICDALAEDLARRLASDYLTHTGNVQAFNRIAAALIGVALEDKVHLSQLMEGLGRSITACRRSCS